MARSIKHFVICVNNEGYEVSLEPRKLYVNVPDPDSEKLGLLRVIDESGEDYLFPQTNFVSIELPLPVQKAVMLVA